MPLCIVGMYCFMYFQTAALTDTYHLVASTDPALPFPAPGQMAHLLQTWAWGLRLRGVKHKDQVLVSTLLS